MPRRTIVHVITRLIAGGADENTVLTCNHQAASGHRVFLVIGASSDPVLASRLAPAVELVTVKWLVRPISPFSDILALAALARLLRRLRPDVLHTHTSKAGILGRLAALFAHDVLVVHSVHILSFFSVDPVQQVVFRALERGVGRFTDLFIHVSPGLRDVYLEAGIGRADRHVVIESGMDIERFRRIVRPTDWRSVVPASAVAVPGRPRFLLLAGALEPRKRVVDFLDRVFAQVAASSPDAVLLVAGDGPGRADLDVAIDRLGLVGRVVPLGFRSDLDRLIGLAEICVHSAHREGLPRVVVQYAAAGRPVVACDLPGIAAVVEQDRSGVLVQADRLEAMVEPIRRLLEDDGLRHAMGESARQRDYSRWSADVMTAEIERAYARLPAAA